MRRLTAGIALACVVALTASACAGSTGKNLGAVSGSGSATSSETILIWADERRAEAIRPFVEKLEEDEGIVVEVEAITSDLQEALIDATEAGQAPDLVVGVHSWIGNLVEAGAIDPIDLSSSKQDDFTSIAVEGVTWDDDLYGVPFAIENLALYRNTELVPDAPQTIEEAVAIGSQLKEAGLVREAMSVPVGESGDAYSLLPLYTSAGAYLFGTTKDGDLDLTDLGMSQPEATEAFMKIASLGEAGLGGLTRSISASNAVSLFATSQAPFLIAGPEALSEIRRAGLGYAISAVPGFYDGDQALSFVSISAFFLASGGDNKDLAEKFVLKYLTDTELPKALYEAEPAPPALTDAFNEVLENDSDMRALLDAGRDGVLVPSVANVSSVLEPFARAGAVAVAGEDVSSAVATAATEMAERLK